MRKIIIILLSLLLASCGNAGEAEYDVCVYGGTSAGVIAAYSAKKMGKTVLLIEPGNTLGGLTSGGLGYTDIGNKQVVTALSKDFYRRMGAHYGKLEQWIFEPKVAESVFDNYIHSAGVEVQFMRRIVDATIDNGRITEIELESSDDSQPNSRVRAKVFIDCSYEGDLMARSKVSYTVGRESNELYNEAYNGVQLMTKHQFPDGIDPYRIAGDSTSGLLWGISPEALASDGTTDSKVQAYNYRICLTDDPDNMLPITRPDNYDSTRYELLLRLIEAMPDKRSLNHYFIWSAMPNRKTDINNRGGFSTDMIGMNYDYPQADYKERERIVRAHKEYTQGLLYFYGHDSRVPSELREQMLLWGYPKDEYVLHGNWSPQLYVREARRMVGEYVMTQANCENREVVSDGIAMAAYTMDSHNCQRIVVKKDGKRMVKNEGNVEIGGGLPYPISYRSIMPRMEECANLLVPVCLSASHIAYGSIRMEPVFMVLAQSAAVAAALAVDGNIPVQSVDVAKVQSILAQNPLLDGSQSEVLVDDSVVDDAQYPGWERISKSGGYGPSYFICKQGGAPFRFRPHVEQKGSYKLYTYFHLSDIIAAQTLYTVFDGRKAHNVAINKNDIVVEGQTTGEWIELGLFNLDAGDAAYVDIVGDPSKGRSVADAVLLIYQQ